MTTFFFEDKKDKKQIELHDDEVYDDIANIEDTMVVTICKTSLRDITMPGTSASVSSDITVGISAQI